MAVDFTLSSLRIKGFRCISDLTIDLPIGAPMFLIGANNSGKSTTLNALAFVLDGGAFYQFEPEPFDFNCDPSGTHVETFTIDLDLSADQESQLPAVQGVGNPIPVYGLRVKGTTDKTGRLSHQHLLFDKSRKPITLSPSIPLKGKAKEAFGSHGVGWRPRNQRPRDISAHVPEVWHLTPDNLNRSLYHWKTGPLQRLAKLLSEKFLETEWTFSFGGQQRQMPEALRKVHQFFSRSVDEFPFWTNEVKPRLEESLSRYIGRETSMRLRPSVQEIEEWLKQQLVLAFSAEAGGPVTPLDRMGDGWQSLVRIAALDVLRQFPDEVKERVALLIEEPETYLHPHLRRKLRDVLTDLAQKGWLVVCTTHAPEFINFGSRQQVVRLWQTRQNPEKGVLQTDSIPEAARLQEKIEEKGSHEMLFANKTVLCEGKDDEYAMRLFLRKAGVDLDGRSVSIIDTGGTGNLADYASIASRLLIPWYAVHDEDKDSAGNVKVTTARAVTALEALVTPRDGIEHWQGDLEACLQCMTVKAVPQWQQSNIEQKTLDELRVAFPEYARTCDAVKTWIET